MIRRHPSPNHERRRGTRAPDTVILHYTGMPDPEAALAWLCNPHSGVSAHYLVFADGRIVQMVDEERRAWHAGIGSWRGASDINSRSIGIEIDNPGHDHGYRDFPAPQMAAVADLLDGIRSRWTVPDRLILAHSDIAPARKIDPGERFAWRWLAARGHGLFPAAPAAAIGSPPSPEAWQARLRAFGYEVPASGDFDEGTRLATAAFQRHFTPHRLDGKVDAVTDRQLAAVEALSAD